MVGRAWLVCAVLSHGPILYPSAATRKRLEGNLVALLCELGFGEVLDGVCPFVGLAGRVERLRPLRI